MFRMSFLYDSSVILHVHITIYCTKQTVIAVKGWNYYREKLYPTEREKLNEVFSE